ncbi:50S ribosomal protein L35 [Thioclava dalianensis]|uniref:50S ribosomal protein L35 n=1 Tax=Thioclava dalianensis TaxID=1185766 RepID=A0A074TQL9_9RHOB|nr:hypothetical protein [Thioclava dalianensis]KEP71238.1 50S ribosomal protein L35 [Thioclava dalianensis]SFM75067.1 hypothetical protein SAMN05216224_101138 [Thioclava dalianensis]
MDLSWLDTDLILTIGLGIAIFAIPALVSAFSDSRPPRAATVSLVISGALILLAVYAKPGGYTMDQVPNAVARTIASVLD